MKPKDNKLFDYFREIYEFRQFEDITRVGWKNIYYNIIRL